MVYLPTVSGHLPCTSTSVNDLELRAILFTSKKWNLVGQDGQNRCWNEHLSATRLAFPTILVACGSGMASSLVIAVLGRSRFLAPTRALKKTRASLTGTLIVWHSVQGMEQHDEIDIHGSREFLGEQYWS